MVIGYWCLVLSLSFRLCALSFARSVPFSNAIKKRLGGGRFVGFADHGAEAVEEAFAGGGGDGFLGLFVGPFDKVFGKLVEEF